MDVNVAVESLTALAQPTRLDAFRLLVRHEPEGLAAGEIARRLEVPHNTMSTHLAILHRAGLIKSSKHGRSVLYRVRLAAIRQLILYLLRDCCGGKPELCAPLIEDLATCRASEGTSCG